jgi:hypothetical protein
VEVNRNQSPQVPLPWWEGLGEGDNKFHHHPRLFYSVPRPFFTLRLMFATETQRHRGKKRRRADSQLLKYMDRIIS